MTSTTRQGCRDRQASRLLDNFKAVNIFIRPNDFRLKLVDAKEIFSTQKTVLSTFFIMQIDRKMLRKEGGWVTNPWELLNDDYQMFREFGNSCVAKKVGRNIVSDWGKPSVPYNTVNHRHLRNVNNSNCFMAFSSISNTYASSPANSHWLFIRFIFSSLSLCSQLTTTTDIL